jgi:hypothetical protein
MDKLNSLSNKKSFGLEDFEELLDKFKDLRI